MTLGGQLTAEVVNSAAVTRYFETFSPAIKRYARQDAAIWPGGGGNAIVDDAPVAVVQGVRF